MDWHSSFNWVQINQQFLQQINEKNPLESYVRIWTHKLSIMSLFYLRSIHTERIAR